MKEKYWFYTFTLILPYVYNRTVNLSYYKIEYKNKACGNSVVN